MQNKHDVIIIGRAATGSSIAYFLKSLAPACAVAVIEPDPTYEFASTPRASGGARRQFSCPENVAMSNFSIPFIKDFADTMAVNREPAHVNWHEGGYFFIVPEYAAGILREKSHALQVGAGMHTPEDSWCDPNTLLQGVRREAGALSVENQKDGALALYHDANAVHATALAHQRTAGPQRGRCFDTLSRHDAILLMAGKRCQAAISSHLCHT